MIDISNNTLYDFVEKEDYYIENIFLYSFNYYTYDR